MDVRRSAAYRFFLQFAGQGTKYWEALSTLHRTTPSLRPFLLAARDTLQGERARYDDTSTAFYPEGVDFLRWLETPGAAPGFDALMASPLSFPLIFLCQTAAFLAVLSEGLEPRTLRRHTHSATGFSTGIVPAVLAASRLCRRDLETRSLLCLAMFFWAGLRVQQATLAQGVRPQLSDEALGDDEGCPSCMAAIGDLPVDEVDAAIAALGRSGTVSLAYEQTASRSVVAGMPRDLADFRAFLGRRHEGFTWRYVLSTAASHSPHHGRAFDALRGDVDRIGLDFSADDLVAPVWSVATGRDLRQSPNLREEVLRGFLLDRGSWPRQVAALRSPGAASHVLDFGPGSGVASLTEGLVGGGLQVLRCGVPVGRHILAKSVVPRLHPPAAAAADLGGRDEGEALD